MHKNSYYIVNAITFYRIIAAPILVLVIINHNFETFKWLLASSFFTDAIDGYLARRYKVESKLGATLDSIGDDLTVAAAMIGMVVLKPDFFNEEIHIFIALFILFVLQVALAISRYGKLTSFHTYAAKIATILQGVFFLGLFFLEGPNYILFFTAAAATAIGLVEEIIIILLLPQWQTNVKGLYWVMKKK